MEIALLFIIPVLLIGALLAIAFGSNHHEELAIKSDITTEENTPPDEGK